MRYGVVVLSLAVAWVTFADEAARHELARYGEIELSTTIAPEQKGAVRASVVFTLAGETVTMMTRSGLTNAAAEQFVRGVSVQQCRSETAGRFILRASASDANSGYYAIDQTKKMWGQYASSLTACPTRQEPTSWHTLASRPTKSTAPASH